MKRYRLVLRFITLLSLMVFALAGCGGGHEHGEAPGHSEAEPIQVTLCSAKSELFMEYGQPVAGVKTEFLIHLTRLSDFKPVTEGGLNIIFTPASGQAVRFTVAAPARPGIYKADIALKLPGKYSLKLITDGKGFADELVIPEVNVLSGGEKVSGASATKKGAIVYLKEQQWAMEFMVAQPKKKDLNNFITVMGELTPQASAEATVSAPLSGIISTGHSLPFIGKRVEKGETLVLIDPPVKPDSGIGQVEAAYADAKNRAVLARKEYNRAKSLHELKIASLKRVEEAEAALASAEAALAPLEKAMGSITGLKGGKLAVSAPIAGTVVEIATGAGKGIEAGQPILRIVNTSSLWLKAHLPANETGVIGNKVDATFTVTGMPGQFRPSRLVSVGNMLDPQTRTLPILFEIANPSGQFKAGQYANVLIKTGLVSGALTLPKEALVEDEGRWFVFIQTTGETFDRQEVKIGTEDGGYVQILQGIRGDERIVTRGAYYVRRAESAGRGGADQGHAH